jgi:hypothetical protein
MFLMSSQVKKSGQCQLRDKKHQYFSIVSLPTHSVIVDHAVFICTVSKVNLSLYFAIHSDSVVINLEIIFRAAGRNRRNRPETRPSSAKSRDFELSSVSGGMCYQDSVKRQS